ncbi:MAG: AAA family ATPase, partial [Planctomycetaceae bacterium]|nr:AAA family ATPase [Planctomycetaceae bacterium]
IYKLHRPLPSSVIQSELWTRTKERYPRNRVVVVSIEDLRRLDAPISRGLSWERTALETIWHLRNNDHFSELCAIPHLIVRLGLDGAIYWGLRQPGAEGHDATLIYDAQTIEGVSDEACDGSMVGYGSAFTAALTSHLARCVEPVLLSGGDLQVQKEHVVAGIKLGITASRSLLKNGFGTPKTGPHDTEWDKAPTKCKQEPQYPGGELFTDRSAQDLPFSDAAIPMIPGAKESDRGYWRLLESKFSGKSRLLTHAVGTLARRSSPLTTEEVSKLSMRRQVGASQPVSDDPREFWRQPEFDAVLEASTLLNAVPIASFGKHLKTYDRREIEHLRALYSLLAEYSRNRKPVRPLSVAVFGPPGAGKSFGVKAVAAELARRQPSRPLQDLTFNLSQYDSPGQLSEAFHLVRDVSLKGKLPLVFFDEFDSRLNRVQLGWLRYFLAPMQDGEFLDKGEIHPIGPAIFIFAGGTSSTYAEFARPLTLPSDDPEWKRFRTVKAPDFLSRLRGALDIPGLDLNAPYDPYGPAENLPSREAVLLRRAMILAHQVKTKAAHLLDSNGTLQISDAALSALIQLPGFVHGNRSFEAILDMSRLTDADRLQPSCFPADSHVELHANPGHLNQLLGTYQFTADEHQKIAAAIHEAYRQKELERIYPDGSIPDDAKLPPNLKAWKDLSTEFRGSNLEQAEHIPFKLRAAGLWFRKRPAAAGERTPPPPAELPDHVIERIARSEHDRWVTERRKQGWIAARGQDRKHRDDALKHHNCLFRWEELDDDIQQKDRDAVTDIPIYLAAAGFELIDQ